VHPPLGRRNALVQRRRLGRGLDPQFLGQQAAAGFILRQRRAALPAAGPRQHQLAVGFLAPGLQRQQPRGAVNCLGRVAALQMQLGQRVERVQRQLAVARPLGQQPVFKLGRVAHHEARQKVALVQRRRRAQMGGAGCGGRIAGRGGQAALERLAVEPERRRRVEAHGVAVN